MHLRKLEAIENLREVWPHEALDFTPWLAEDDHIVILSEAIGLEISVDEIESAVGGFSVDILASETGTERTIIIENQLEDTDHDHLGKLITYASGKSADIIVWVVKHAREEHRSAVEWLNRHTDDQIGIFLCEIKLYRIGNSDPAVKFEVIEKPNDWTKEIRKIAATSKTEQLRLEYWHAFQDYAFQNDDFSKQFNRRKPSKDNWIDYSIGSAACRIVVSQVRTSCQLTVSLYIDDMALFQTLFENKDSIEAETGLSLDWRPLPGYKASRILATRTVDYDDRMQWSKQFDWLMTVMVKMKKAFAKYL